MNAMVLKRFWEKVEKTPTCWLWTGSRNVRNVNSYDYGRFRLNSKTELAHRVSWILNNGEIPEGLDVLHKCDIPPCVRPDHLFLGNDSDNQKDSMRKGRVKREDRVKAGRIGARSLWSKLSPAQRLEHGKKALIARQKGGK